MNGKAPVNCRAPTVVRAKPCRSRLCGISGLTGLKIASDPPRIAGAGALCHSWSIPKALRQRNCLDLMALPHQIAPNSTQHFCQIPVICLSLSQPAACTSDSPVLVTGWHFTLNLTFSSLPRRPTVGTWLCRCLGRMSQAKGSLSWPLQRDRRKSSAERSLQGPSSWS